MDINRLRYFCAIVQTQNMRRASELLHVSPPALSKAMKVFEAEVGMKLMNQVGRGIMITDQGKVFHKRAVEVLKQIDELKNTRDEKKTPLSLRIGSFEVFTTYFIGPLFGNHLPQYHCELHEFIPGHLEQALSSSVIDVGITYIPIPHPELDHLRVGKIQMGLFALKDKFQKIPFSELPFVIPISPIEGSPTKTRGLDGWPDDTIPRFQKYKVTLMESALEFCRRGLAVGYFPKFVVQLHNEEMNEKFRLVDLALPKGMVSKLQFQEVYLVKRKSTVEDEITKKIAKAIRMECVINN